MASPDSYIDWIIRKAQAIPQPKSYSNRRRLAEYDLRYDENYMLVGKLVKNPITGFNYAYQTRTNPDYASEVDSELRKQFDRQAVLVSVCMLYSWWTGGWRDVVNMLVWPVLVTEAKGFQFRRRRPDKHGITREQFIQEAVRVCREGPNSDRELPVWTFDFKTWELWSKALDSTHYRYENQGVDAVWVAGALWQRWVEDDSGLVQGISIVGNSAAAHVITRFWVHGGYKKNPLLWVLAGAAHWLGWKYLSLYLGERKRVEAAKAIGISEAPPAKIDHKAHLYGAALGAWTGTVSADNKWQAAAKNNVYIRALSGKL